MSRKRPVRTGAGILGVGVLACAACCAGPLIAFAGSIGAASLLGAYWMPALLIVALIAGVVLTVLLVRRRRAKACRVPAAPIAVSIQTRAELQGASTVSGARQSAP